MAFMTEFNLMVKKTGKSQHGNHPSAQAWVGSSTARIRYVGPHVELDDGKAPKENHRATSVSRKDAEIVRGPYALASQR